MTFPRATEFAHLLVSRHLRPGDRAVDATVGNGHDTLFLAETVGTGGRVDGFEIQPDAIRAARARLQEYPQVILHQAGHETMAERLSPGRSAVMFNLGYFPSGDKGIITRAETTLPALDAALALLVEGGLLTVVVYPGHPGGEEEARAVDAWFARFESGPHRTLRCGPATVSPGAAASPYLLALEKRETTVVS